MYTVHNIPGSQYLEYNDLGSLLLVLYSFYTKLKNVSCEYDRWVVETQLCKLRDTSDTLIGRACAMYSRALVLMTQPPPKMNLPALDMPTLIL